MTVPGKIEALLLGPMRLGKSKVPFTDVSCFVACRFQNFRQSYLRGLEVVFALGQKHWHIRRCLVRPEYMSGWLWRLMACRARDAVASGVLSGQETGSGWGAKRLCIGIGKPHRPLRKAVDIWRLIILGAIRSTVSPAHVVGQKEDHIRLAFLGEPGARDQECAK